jgi:hypothetical protein
MTRPAPYPATTRAKGWRFELDYERIDQSDTWDLAAEIPMAQHALLMMWLVAWRQDPCGSLPADESTIRAKCRIPQATWETCREVCMRGWWLADDGRLYHDTLTQRVLEMTEYRGKEAARRAGNRAKHQDATVSPDVVPRDATASPDTGTGTGTNTDAIASVGRAKEKAARASRRCPESFEPPDPRAWVDANCPGLDWQRETAKFRDHTFRTPISDWLAAWRNWMRRASDDRSGAKAMTFRERDAQNAIAKVHEMTGGLASPKPTRRADVLQEIFDATPRLLG